MAWGDSFINGFSAITDAKDKKENRRLSQAELSLRQELVNKELDGRAAEMRAKREAEQAALDKAARDQADKKRELDADPVVRFQRAKAEKDFAELNKPKELTADQKLDLTVKDLQRQKLEKELMGTPKTGLEAKVIRAFGEDGRSRVEYPVAIGDVERIVGASSYKSPYAEQIAELGGTIADQESEMDGGDNRTGFLNLTSRKDEVTRANNQRRRLQAMELQDMLAKGIITPEEADRRANSILGVK